MSMLTINFTDFHSMLLEYGGIIAKSDVCGLKEQQMHLKYKGAGFNSYYLEWDSFTIIYSDSVLNNPVKIHFDSEQETVEMYFILSGNSKTNFNHLLNPFCMDSNQHNIFFIPE